VVIQSMQKQHWKHTFLTTSLFKCWTQLHILYLNSVDACTRKEREEKCMSSLISLCFSLKQWWQGKIQIATVKLTSKFKTVQTFNKCFTTCDEANTRKKTTQFIFEFLFHLPSIIVNCYVPGSNELMSHFPTVDCNIRVPAIYRGRSSNCRRILWLYQISYHTATCSRH